ncbi:MAG: histidine phosphatase family protein [Burkholderiaceae bacterium]
MNDQRRRILRLPLALLAAGSGGLTPSLAAAQEAVETVRAGGCAVMIRHAQTVPGIGDPPEFVLDRCETQRNLSEAGREQAACIGRWFAERALSPRQVLSSQWCRCRDTARIAFGEFRDLPALNSTFQNRGDAPGQLAAIRSNLRDIPDGQFDILVTHQVIITAVTGRGTQMGEALIVDRDGRMLARLASGCMV